MQPFLVYALPRSRTYWLSHFLTYRDWNCGHDQLRYCRSLEDVTAWLSLPCTGTCETAAAPFWRLAKDIKSVVIRRPVEEVVDSVIRQGFKLDRAQFTKHIQWLNRKLDQIECRVPNVLSVSFDELKKESVCKRVFEFCLPYPHDHRWWAKLAKLNLQIDMHHLMRYVAANQTQLDKLAKVAKYQIITGMSRSLTDIEHDDGVTIQEEKLATAFRDGGRLFEQHCVLVGESPDEYWRKNLPLMQRLEDLGSLQVMTARCNGRLFGYLVTVISPSLEKQDLKVGTQTTFFADPSFKGLGMRLQRAAVERLREKGVGEAYFHAGVRGMGPRMGTVYRRIGAESHGQWFRLELN